MKLDDTRRNWHALGKQDPLLAILTYKEKRGGKWEINEFFETGVREVRATFNYLRGLGINLKGGRALDFGCGVGRLTQALVPRFEETVGVDIASSMINLANRYNRYPEKCDYLVNTADNLRLFPEKSFDFIFSKITLQHVEPRYAKNYIREFLRLAKPEGIILFQLPTESVGEAEASPLLRSRVKTLLPSFVLATYYRVKHHFSPMLEMYGVPHDEVLAIVAEGNGKVIDSRENQDSGEKWRSFSYVAVKNS